MCSARRLRGSPGRHRTGDSPQRQAGQLPRFAPVDSLRAELEAFADAVAGRAAYPITSDEMLGTIAAFEALVTSAETGRPIAC